MGVCGFSRPREGGVYGVWASSMAFGLASLTGFGLEVLLGVLGGILSLFLSDARRVNPVCIILPSVLFTPLILAGLPFSVFPILLFPPLFYATLRGGVLRYVTGAGLVALPGGLLALSSHQWASILPPSYAMMASGLAYRRIYGSSPMGLEFGSGAAVALYGIGMVYQGYIAGYVLIVDLLVRVVLRTSGFDYRVRLRTYGFIEAFRSFTVMLLTGLLI